MTFAWHHPSYYKKLKKRRSLESKFVSIFSITKFYGLIFFIEKLSNLLVLPATCIPFIDLISNIFFLVAFIYVVKTNILISLALCVVFIHKNNYNEMTFCNNIDEQGTDFPCKKYGLKFNYDYDNQMKLAKNNKR